MSTENTPDSNAQPDSPAAGNAEPKGPDGYAAAFRSMQADLAAVQSEVKMRDRKISELVAERDKKVRELEVERDTFKNQVEQYGRQQREGAIVEGIRVKLPHLSAFEIRGSLAALHEEGVIDRYSEKPDEAAAAAIEAMKTKAPAMLRPPAQGGGPGGAPQQAARPKSKTLI